MAIADIASDAGERLAAELGAGGAEASYHGHDVTDPDAWRDARRRVERTHGLIDVLVNNAGIQVRSVGIEADDEEWAKVIAVNQRGAFLGMRAVIPSMKRNGGGSIVNIASVAALVGLPGSIPVPGEQGSRSRFDSRGRGLVRAGQHPRKRDLPRAGRHGDDRQRVARDGRGDEGADPAEARRSSRGDLGGRPVPGLGRVVLHHRRRAADRRRLRRDLAPAARPSRRSHRAAPAPRRAKG